MMTVVDPGGTPAPVYNADGVTIDTLTATTDGIDPPAPVVRYCGWTVVLVSESSGGKAIILPANAEIGDLVEIHLTRDDTNVTVYPDSGSQINTLGTDNLISVVHALFRKTGTSQWNTICNFHL